MLMMPGIKRGKNTNDLNMVIGSKDIYIYIYTYTSLYIFHEISDMREKKQTLCK